MRGEVKLVPRLPMLKAHTQHPGKGMDRKLKVVLALPGEAELPLLTELRQRDDVDIMAIVDPTGASVAAALAEIMGVAVIPEIAAAQGVPGVVVVLPATASAETNDLAATAEALGLEVLPAADLRPRLARALVVERRAAPVATVGDAEDCCTTAQLALAHLEESLALDTLVPQLLDLAIRAVGARHGSLMLADAAGGALHIAAARGLGEGTLKQTRLTLGESIAGRVAQNRRAELLRGGGDSGEGHRDRPDITTAASVPLVHDDVLLGVLNVSTSLDEPPLGDDALAVLETLAGRIAHILARSLRLRRAALRDTLTAAVASLRALAAAQHQVPDLLCAWTHELIGALGASRVTLAVTCADGNLLFAESAAGETSRAWHEPLHDPAWQSVFTTGTPLVARTTGEEAITIVFLPLGDASAGNQLPGAGLAVQLRDAGRAAELTDHWPQLSGELSALLAEHVERRVAEVRHCRLLALAEALVDLATVERSPGQLAERVCRVAAELTGAQRTAAVVSIGGAGVRLAGGDAPDDAPWLAALPPLVGQAAAAGWRATTLEGDLPPLSILVATCEPGRQTPALVLVGKERVHPLDGEGFTRDDADLVVALAALLRRLPATGRTASPDSAGQLAAAPPLAEPLPTPAGESSLVFALRREMSRCERYHNVFGLLVVHLPADVATAGLAARLAARLRTSDRVFDLGGGELVVLAPEDVQNLDHLERRLRDELNSLAGPAAAAAPVTRTVFPGPSTSPQDFLKRARRHD